MKAEFRRLSQRSGQRWRVQECRSRHDFVFHQKKKGKDKKKKKVQERREAASKARHLLHPHKSVTIPSNLVPPSGRVRTPKKCTRSRSCGPLQMVGLQSRPLWHRIRQPRQRVSGTSTAATAGEPAIIALCISEICTPH